MKRFLSLALAALMVLACTPASKDDPHIPFAGGGGSSTGGSTGGGSTTPPAASPTVTTGDASEVTSSSALIESRYADAPKQGAHDRGILYGTSAGELSLKRALGSDKTSASTFRIQLTDLKASTTYYYKAYISVWSNTESKYVDVVGQVKQFTTGEGTVTPPPTPPTPTPPTPSAGVPTWAELPAMSTKTSGNYLVNATDADLYYAWHYTDLTGPGNRAARNYTVCYSAEYHCPMWVAAPRHKMYQGSTGRTDAYGTDPKIPSGIQYKSKSTGGGCNKGHMLGSAERTASRTTNEQVFHYTNIAPQLSSGFNTGGGGWNLLEDYVDTQVCKDTLYEVIGCYFKKYTDGYGKTAEPTTISFGGRNDVTRPTMFYYVLLRTKNGNSGKSVKDCSASELKCVAFVRTHTNDLKGQKPSSRELMSVSDLEKITGVSYFPNIPNAPKSSFSASDWGL
jgi:DNA/RNA endonuclease G (NUC1)